MNGPTKTNKKNVSNNRKGVLLKIKNLYVLKKIFSYLTKIKTLQLIRYSKKMQSLLGVDIHLFKIFNEIIKYRDETDEDQLFEKVKASFYHSPIFKDEVINCIKRFLFDNQKLSFIKLKGFTLRGHHESVLCVIQLTNGCICSSSLDRSIKIWNFNTHKCEYSLFGHNDDVSCIIQSKQRENILYSSSDDRTIKIWDLDKKECLKTLQGHEDIIFNFCLKEINDNIFIASGSDDSTIKIWNFSFEDIASPEKIITTYKTLGDHTSSVTVVSSINDDFFASGSCDESILIWMWSSYSVKSKLMGHKGTIYALLFHKSLNYLISGAEDKTIKLWSLVNYNCDYTFPIAHKNDISGLCLDVTDSNCFFSCSIDKSITKWNLSTKKKEYILQGHSGPVNSIIMLNNGMLCSGSEDKNIKVWNLTVHSENFSLHNGIEAFVETHQNALVYKNIKIIE